MPPSLGSVLYNDYSIAPPAVKALKALRAAPFLPASQPLVLPWDTTSAFLLSFLASMATALSGQAKRSGSFASKRRIFGETLAGNRFEQISPHIWAIHTNKAYFL